MKTLRNILLCIHLYSTYIFLCIPIHRQEGGLHPTVIVRMKQHVKAYGEGGVLVQRRENSQIVKRYMVANSLRRSHILLGLDGPISSTGLSVSPFGDFLN